MKKVIFAVLFSVLTPATSFAVDAGYALNSEL
jgi:hypothetical protein